MITAKVKFWYVQDTDDMELDHIRVKTYCQLDGLMWGSMHVEKAIEEFYKKKYPTAYDFKIKFFDIISI